MSTNHHCDNMWVPQEGIKTPMGKGEPCQRMKAMWVTAPSSTQPQTVCNSAARSFSTHFFFVAQLALRSIGQCMFGLTMLFIIAGISLCIWGYIGTPIRPFQIFGPVCIGIGLLIYIISCVLCCREYPMLEKTLQKREMQEKAKSAIELLARPKVIECIQEKPELYDDFRIVATKMLNSHGMFSSNGNVIANLYANKACPDA